MVYKENSIEELPKLLQNSEIIDDKSTNNRKSGSDCVFLYFAVFAGNLKI